LVGKTVNKELFLELYNQLKPDFEIASIMNIDRSVICFYRKHILQLPKHNIHDSVVLTQRQKEIIVGTLLGDSTVRKSINTIYPKLYVGHTLAQKELLEFLNIELNILNFNFINIKEKEKVIKGKKTIEKESYQIHSKHFKALQEFRDIFYQNGIKIIPIDYLNNNFTPLSLAVLFMDDGNKNLNTISLNLQGFELDNLKEFVLFLKEKFNLDFIIKKDKTLYLRYKSRMTFYNLVYPYILSTFNYKISRLVSSLNLVNLGNS
jgi:hypothetical protein